MKKFRYQEKLDSTMANILSDDVILNEISKIGELQLHYDRFNNIIKYRYVKNIGVEGEIISYFFTYYPSNDDVNY